MGWLEWIACAFPAVVLAGIFAWWRWCERLAAEDDALKLKSEAWVRHIEQHAEAVKRQMALEASVVETDEAHVAAYSDAANRWCQEGMRAQEWMTDIVRKYRAEHDDLAAQRRMDEVEL